MRHALLAFSLIFLTHCSKPALTVSQFHLRNSKMLSKTSPMVRAEALYRYDNNLSQKDRLQKHGHYYVVRWDPDEIDQSSSDLKLSFKYRQASSGQKGKTITHILPANSAPQYEIIINGPEYLKNGRILAWKATLSQGGEIIGTEQSFLWD